MKQFDDDQIEQQRQLVKDQLNKLNRNVDVPMPKCLTIMKVAVQIPEYNHLRVDKEVFDLAEPADPVDLSTLSTNDFQFLFNGTRRRRIQKKGPRVR